MKYKIAVWGSLSAGVLGIFTGLRDIFAPGFFNMSPRVPSKTDIIVQFAVAAMFFALAALTYTTSHQNKADHK